MSDNSYEGTNSSLFDDLMEDQYVICRIKANADDTTHSKFA